MKVLIWIVKAILTTELVLGDLSNGTDTVSYELFWRKLFEEPTFPVIENNSYKDALLAHPWESVQKYVTVRPGAHMFYWLYYADGKRVSAESKPLIIWIQGGPGYAASGIGNFREIGPLTMDMKPRNHTWVKGRNVLLFDHPVGTGFSYVRNISLLAKTDREIANDLTKAIQEFFRINPEFRETPTYIFGQSYGGKICPRLAYYLHTAIENGSLIMNFKGIGIGSGLVDPMQSISKYPEFLYNKSLINQEAYVNTSAIVNEIRKSIDDEDYGTAADWLTTLFQVMYEETAMSVNFNNVNLPSPIRAQYLLERNMNTYVKPMLSHVVDQTIEWTFISVDVLFIMKENILIPSTTFLEKLLNETDLKVAVYNGDLDVLTPLAGAMNWVHNLHWNGSEEFLQATQHPIRGTNSSFYKEAKQLSLWCVFGAGHWVPEDEPVAMEQILQYLISD